MIARITFPVTVWSPMSEPTTRRPTTNRMSPSMMYATTRAPIEAGASAADAAWTDMKASPFPRRRRRRVTSAGSISGRVVALGSRFAPGDVGREFRLQEWLERSHVCGETSADAFLEGAVQRGELDGLPDPGPSFVPTFDSHLAVERTMDRALPRAEGGKETSVCERIGLEVQADLDDAEPFAYPGFVVQLPVARPELRHVRVRHRMEPRSAGRARFLSSRGETAEERARIESAGCGCGGGGRRPT